MNDGVRQIVVSNFLWLQEWNFSNWPIVFWIEIPPIAVFWGGCLVGTHADVVNGETAEGVCTAVTDEVELDDDGFPDGCGVDGNLDLFKVGVEGGHVEGNGRPERHLVGGAQEAHLGRVAESIRIADDPDLEVIR